jgi:hypothetical protein
MLTFVCIFCSLFASVLYSFAGEPGGLPAILDVAAAYLFPASLALWVRADAAKRGSPLPYDLDSFVFVFWPVAAPVYLLRTRGWRGCGPIFLFILLATVVVLLESLLVTQRSYLSP